MERQQSDAPVTVTRRGFFAALAGLPLVGRVPLVPQSNWIDAPASAKYLLASGTRLVMRGQLSVTPHWAGRVYFTRVIGTQE